MREKKSFGRRVGEFLAGRGFYIVLFACIAVIGVSAWMLLFPGLLGGGAEEPGYIDYTNTTVITPTPGQQAFSPVTPTTTPRPIPTPTPTPIPTPTPAPTSAATPTPTPTPQPPANEHGGSSAKTISDLTFARPLAGDISQEYAVETLVYNRTMGDWRTHAGIDIAGALGAKVQAACDGTVTEIRSDDLLGTVIVIDHGFGLSSAYANMASAPPVAVGDKVSLGAVIGSIGDTALGETGEVTHLHFAMTQDGKSIDPLKYLP
jgi:murein DD-endopeptidase MepM/ murein hydrolase activator NlpD